MGRLKIRRKQSKKTKSTFVGPPIDRRAVEKSISDITKVLQNQEFQTIDEANEFLEATLSSGTPLKTPSRTPLEKAQNIMYDAWDSSGRRRIELAHKALKISPDCADAYVLLAEETARSLEEAKVLYEQGAKAGERALGPQGFEEGIGHFWGILETRPYMRARAGLAQCLWMLGKRREAIEHYTDMLRLNPNDNQGIRYWLAQHLLEERRDEAFSKLLRQYPDDAAASWLYTRALWFYRQEGESKKSNSFLKGALKVNPFVPSYLLGSKKIPNHLPEYIGWGDESEAFTYASEAIHLWEKTEGALEWLTKNLTGRSSQTI